MKRIVSHFSALFATPTRTTVFTNTTSQVLGRLIQSGTTFFITLILARTYGSQGYGEYTKVVSYVPLFYLIADFGMNALYVKERADRIDKYLQWQNLLSTRFLFSIVLTAVSFLFILFLPSAGSRGFTPFVKLGVYVFLPTVIFQGLITSANAAFQKFKRYDFAAIATAGGSLISLLGTVSVVSLYPGHLGILYSLMALAAGTFVISVISLFYAYRLAGGLRFHADFHNSIRLLRQSIPLAITLICNLIYFRADIFILTYLRTTGEVGVYGFAYRFFEFALVVPTFFMNALFPHLVTARNPAVPGDGQRYRSLVQKSGKLLFMVSLVTSGAFWIGAPLLGLVRPEFAASIPLLRILSLGIPFFFLSSLTMWMIITEGRYKELAAIYVLSMLINIGSNFIGIPFYGAYASAWVTTLSELFTLCVSFLYLKYLRVV